MRPTSGAVRVLQVIEVTICMSAETKESYGIASMRFTVSVHCCEIRIQKTLTRPFRTITRPSKLCTPSTPKGKESGRVSLTRTK